MTLREAARRTSRSVTTLRRHIRSGRLRAEKRPGRFGPEYFVSEDDLGQAGLATLPAEVDAAPPAAPRSRRENSPSVRAAADAVPLSLYRELQMKHEQLLVQYGMMRAGGLKALEIRADLDATRNDLEAQEGENLRLRNEHADEANRLRESLRQAELEQEGRALEITALREKVRALEMLTRNAATNESIERQFAEMMEQARRVNRLASTGTPREDDPNPWPPPRRANEPEH